MSPRSRPCGARRVGLAYLFDYQIRSFVLREAARLLEEWLQPFRASISTTQAGGRCHPPCARSSIFFNRLRALDDSKLTSKMGTDPSFLHQGSGCAMPGRDALERSAGANQRRLVESGGDELKCDR